MAKTAMVKLTAAHEWQEVEIANFYDPEKHNTIRIPGTAKKIPYSKMKMQDGRIYDKDKDKWEMIIPKNKDIILGHPLTLPLPYEQNSVGSITLLLVLERCDDIIALMKELERVLVPFGGLKITLPLAPGHLAFSDPETKNYFNESTLRHFAKGQRYDLFSNYTCTTRGEILDITLKKQDML